MFWNLKQKETNMRNKFRNTKGFTLIELLIVVAIIGIISAIAIPQFSSYRQKAYNSSAKSDLTNFKLNMEAYYVEHSQYPDIIN